MHGSKIGNKNETSKLSVYYFGMGPPVEVIRGEFGKVQKTCTHLPWMG